MKPHIPEKERVGVLLVHGIGEQRRYEHLAEMAKDIALSLKRGSYKRWQKLQLSVKICPHSPYKANEQTWSSEGETITIDVQDSLGKITKISFQEVWWADLGEPTTIKTFINFWLWGLSLWTNTGYYKNLLIDNLADKKDDQQDKMRLPEKDGLPVSKVGFRGRVELFFISLIAFLIVPVLAVINRFLKIIGIEIRLDIISQYLSRAKIFQQQTRKSKQPIINLDEPPRVAIRKRMVKGIINMALKDYDRWYILAHSQGSILAFNGLMEIDQIIPNYLYQDDWEKLKDKNLISLQENPDLIFRGEAIPQRPIWVKVGEYIDRKKLFKSLKGFMTYGSPLSKFAVLWPALVRINKDENVFAKDFEWINVFDPTDPVAGRTHYFQPKENGVQPMDIPYKSKGFHLLSHLGYFKNDDKRSNNLVDAVSQWLLYGDKFNKPKILKTWQIKYLAFLKNVGWFSIGIIISLLPSIVALVYLFISFVFNIIVELLTFEPRLISRGFYSGFRYISNRFNELFFDRLDILPRMIAVVPYIVLGGFLLGCLVVLIVGLLRYIFQEIDAFTGESAEIYVKDFFSRNPNKDYDLSRLRNHFSYYRFRGLKNCLEKLVAQKVIYQKTDQNGFIKSYSYPTLKIKATEEAYSSFKSISNTDREYILSSIHRELRANPKLINKNHDKIQNIQPYLIKQEIIQNNTLTNNIDEDSLWLFKVEDYIIFHTLASERYSSAPIIDILFICKVSRLMDDLSSILTSNPNVKTNLKSIYQQYLVEKNRYTHYLDSNTDNHTLTEDT